MSAVAEPPGPIDQPLPSKEFWIGLIGVAVDAGAHEISGKKVRKFVERSHERDLLGDIDEVTKLVSQIGAEVRRAEKVLDLGEVLTIIGCTDDESDSLGTDHVRLAQRRIEAVRQLVEDIRELIDEREVVQAALRQHHDLDQPLRTMTRFKWRDISLDALAYVEDLRVSRAVHDLDDKTRARVMANDGRNKEARAKVKGLLSRSADR